MLKVIQPGAGTFNPAAREIEHPIYWKREVLTSQSGLLEDLPGGIVALRWLAIEEWGKELCWLWLEGVQDHTAIWQAGIGLHTLRL